FLHEPLTIFSNLGVTFNLIVTIEANSAPGPEGNVRFRNSKL
ncbi:unnamed protein product, partial [Allacma fusca]